MFVSVQNSDLLEDRAHGKRLKKKCSADIKQDAQVQHDSLMFLLSTGICQPYRLSVLGKKNRDVAYIFMSVVHLTDLWLAKKKKIQF